MATPFALDAFDAELSAEVKQILTRVESRLLQATEYDDGFIREMAEHLAKAGGKRFHRGFILYTGSDTIQYDKNLWAIPVSALWSV